MGAESGLVFLITFAFGALTGSLLTLAHLHALHEFRQAGRANEPSWGEQARLHVINGDGGRQ